MADAAQTNQRSELHKTIWAIADELRGSVDGWDFKHYVLGTPAASGYVWHTAGSGKTLTSFLNALLAGGMEGVDKVLFVADPRASRRAAPMRPSSSACWSACRPTARAFAGCWARARRR